MYTYLFLSVFLLFYHTLLGAAPATEAENLAMPVWTIPDNQEYFTTNKDSKISVDQNERMQKVDQAIGAIKGLLNKNLGPAKVFELQMRLGNLYLEKHDMLYDSEVAQHEVGLKKWYAAGRKGKSPTVQHEQSRSQLANAANTFRKNVKDFAKNRRFNSALLALGTTLARMGDDSSLLYLEQFAKNYPKSPLLPAAQLARAEFYFSKGNYQAARDSFAAVMAVKNNDTYPIAVYRTGWAFFADYQRNAKKDLLEKAETSFRLASKLGSLEKSRTVGRLQLKQASYEALQILWTETQNTDDARKFFMSEKQTDRYFDVLQHSGVKLVAAGKLNEATKVFETLTNEKPMRAETPFAESMLLSLYDNSTQIDKISSRLQMMVKRYQPGSEWQKAFKYPQANELTQDRFEKYGSKYFNMFEKSKQVAMLNALESIHGTYLEKYAQAEKAYQMRYQYADILAARGKMKEAAEQYETVSRQKGEYAHASSLKAVTVRARLASAGKYAALPPNGQVPQPVAIPSLKDDLQKAQLHFTRLFPKDNQTPQFLYEVATVNFAYGYYDTATKIYNQIIAESPQSQQAAASARSLVDFHLLRKEWIDAVKVANALLDNKQMKDKALLQFLTNAKRQAMFNQALAYESMKKFADAGRQYMAFQREFPNETNVSDKALQSAGINFRKEGMLEDAIASDKKLIEAYPRSAYTPPALLNIARAYEALAQFDRSAGYYRAYATSYPKSGDAPEALYKSANMFNGLQHYTQASELYAKYLSAYPQGKISSDIRFTLARLMANQKNFKAAVNLYRDAAQSVRNDPERYYFALARSAALKQEHLSEKQGQLEIEDLRKQLSARKGNDLYEARQIVAQSLFQATEPAFKRQLSLKIDKADKVEQQIKQKQLGVNEVQAVYQQIMEVGNAEYAAAALFRMGQLNEDFSAALLDAPAPQGSSQVEVSKFKSTIEKAAFPLKEKAFNNFEQAYKRSQEIETVSNWPKEIYDKMTELAPAKYPEINEQSAQPVYMSHRVEAEPATQVIFQQ